MGIGSSIYYIYAYILITVFLYITIYSGAMATMYISDIYNNIIVKY